MSLPRYEQYKDSGVPWLGEVPAHWEVKPLKSVAAFVNGCAFKPEQWVEDGTPIIRIENLNGSDFFNRFCGVVDVRYHVENGDLLFGWSGNRGTSFGPFLWPGVGLYFLNQHIFKICRFDFDKSWFYWTLKAVTAHVEDQAHGIIGMVHITKSDLGAIKIPITALSEQKAIAAFLDRETAKIDDLVAEQENLIGLLKEKRQALISRAVTKGLDPGSPMKDSGVEWLGKVPEHWIVKRIRHIAEILRGKFTHRPRNDPAFYDGEYPFVQTGDITSAEQYITTFKQTLNQRGADVSKEFPKGTLVMAIAANIGDVAILDFPAYFPDSIVGLVPQLGINLQFLFYLMMAMKGPMIQTATISTQMNLNVDQIASLIAGCPPTQEQVTIVSFLDSETTRLDALATEASLAITLLQERRTALISAAVTGKIDVRDRVSLQPTPELEVA